MEKKETTNKEKEEEVLDQKSEENTTKEDSSSEISEKKTSEKKSSEKKSSKGKATTSSSENKKNKKKFENKKDVKINELNEEVLKLNDKYLRLSAEFDNYRKRTLKEKMDLTKFAGKKIFENILPVLDDMERAKDSIEKSKDMETLIEGLDLIYNKLTLFLTQEGVQSMDSKGKEFDTDEHEAITKIPAPTDDMKGKVVDVIQKGYKLNDQILRYSKVIVGE
jgi:molecular chaperone GrpE